MASSSEYSDGRKSPGNRRVPHALTTSFFTKTKKGGDLCRSPTMPSPTSTHKPPFEISVIQTSGASAAQASRDNGRTEPIAIPTTSTQPASYKHHKKLAPSTSFNTHYRSISRSMNDLGNIFSRGRSPPNRDISPRRPSGPTTVHTAQENRRKAPPDSPRTKLEPGSVPSISVMQHGEYAAGEVVREGWLNVIDSNIKKAALRESWKLHYAMISEGQMLLYKPPSSFQIKAFDIAAGPPSPQRPQSAPATASPTFNVSSLRHKSTTRHPELIFDDDGRVRRGTPEALCHELMFTEDAEFVYWGARMLSAWSGPETALSVLVELSTLKNSSARIGEILQTVASATPGLLLDSGFYNCARLLAEKGIGPHNQELARESRRILETTRAQLQEALGITDTPDVPTFVTPDFSIGISKALTADEFMRIDPEIFASQVQLFHLKYFRAWSPTNDISLLFVAPHLPQPTHRNPLVFSASSIHFLGDRLLNHVLCGESAHHIDQRVAILSQWIQVAHLLKKYGDMVGYLAIIMVVLSPPILRLRETWTAMSPALVEELCETGSTVMRTLERRRLGGSSDRVEAKAFVPRGVGTEFPCSEGVPFFGDLLHCMDDAYASRDRNQNIDYQKLVIGLEDIARCLSKWSRNWIDVSPGLVPRQRNHTPKEIDQIQSSLQYLNSSNQNPPSTNSTVYFEKSLACEPAATGMYLRSHYHQTLPLSTGANVPLIFTDIRANFSLFDRSDTLAISGSLHKKTPSSGLSSVNPPPGGQSNQSLRPPSSPGPQPVIRRIRSFPPSNPSAQTTGYDDLDFTTRERTAVLHGGDDAMLRAIRDVAGVGQQLFHSKDGELVLKAINDDSPSRPTSVIETTSNRQSMVSRRYSQVLSTTTSPRESMHADSSVPGSPLREGFELERPESLLVVPKGGTLERLVDILVLGVEDFSRRMTRVESGDHQKPPMLRMDMGVFTITFFATFRSYCSPVVLIDYLKKRLLGSKSAASFYGDESDDVVFPDWTGIDHVKEDAIDWNLVARIHFGILDAINIWLTEFYMDFHCDQYLSESFVSFLDIAAKELAWWRSSEPDKYGMRMQADEIDKTWNSIKNKFSSLSFTPSIYETPGMPISKIDLSIPPPNNVGSISDFIETLDLRVSEYFTAVKLVDWMFAFELLEAQSAEPMGFFVPKMALLSYEEEDAIQDIFFLLNKLRRENGNTSLLQALPKSLRDLCTLHMELTDWIVFQIADPKLSFEGRTQRLTALLKGLAICRQRMSRMDLHDNSDSGASRPRHVPSFVGSAISTALVRPESRMFSYAWQMAAKQACGTVSQCETLEQIIPPFVDGVITDQPLTTSVGWMLERLLEIVCHVPNMVVENNRLINFDKRRYVYNFINNFTNPLEKRAESGRRPSLFSLKIIGSFDVRAVREAASKENALTRHGKLKIFWKIVQREQEKIRRDAKQRESMERQQKQQMRAEHRRQPTAGRVEVTDKKSGKRLGVNSIFKAVRPISMAFTSGWTPPQSSLRIIPPSELPSFKGLEHGRKPVVTLDLRVAASVSCPQKTRDKIMWKITSASGTGYLFQATSEKDLDEWLKAIVAIRGVAVTEGADSIDLLTVASTNRTTAQPVFGVSLEELCKRDKTKVPLVVEALLAEIEARGLSEVGIYRVPGSLASINALKSALDAGEEVRMDDDRWYDINVIAGVFKSFMRELPEQALEPDILNELRNLTVEVPDEEDRVPRYREVMMKLQPHNYHFLRRVYIHFSRIAGNAAVNKMHAVNLAIVFGMGLSPNTDHPFGVSPDLGLYQTMVKTWITYADHIFPEVVEDDETVETSTSVAQTDSADIPSEPNSPVSPVFHAESNSSMRSLDGPLSGRSHNDVYGTGQN